MYTHILYIDDEPVTVDGTLLTNGSVAGMLEIPPFKRLYSTDWFEHDGLDVDLSDPQLDAGKIKLTLTADQLGMLPANEYIMHIGVSNTLIDFTECIPSTAEPKYSHMGAGREVVTYELQVLDDIGAFLKQYRNYRFRGSIVAQPYGFTSYTTGNFGKWGVVLLKGWYDAVHSHPAAKLGMLRNIASYPSLIADENIQHVRKKERSFTLQFLLNIASPASGDTDIEAFWKQYYSFIWQFISPGVKTIIDSGGNTINCYYSSMNVVEYMPTEPYPWLKFNVKLKTIHPQ